MTEVPYSGEKVADTGEIKLAYDTFGNPSSSPILLIMGLGAQMVRWDKAFCQYLAANNRWVIRFDNRDVGLSTKFDEAGVPDVMSLIQGKSVDVPYKLKDMAKDAIGLLDHLEIEKAHVVGVSMGGMIAQTIAINYPDRVRTLTSIMSSTSNPELPQPKPEAMALLVAPPAKSRDEYLRNALASAKVLHGPVYKLNEDLVRKYSESEYDRCYNPQGFSRQLAAVLASGSRSDALKDVKIPSLVIHGDADPLVPVEGGKDTANCIPGAKMVIIEGMGHSFPTEKVPQIIQAILQHTSQ